MPLKKSPGGSIFPYPYKNGQLFGLHLGSFGADEDGVIARIKAEQAFFAEQNVSIGIWIDFYQTKLTDRVLGEFFAWIERARDRILKLGLAGCSSRDRRRIDRLVKGSQELATMPLRYFDDPEDAKTWLVSEGR